MPQTTLSKGRLYEISGWSSLPGALKPTISFIGVSGTLNQYGSNKKPTALSEMSTETADDITANKNFKLEGIVRYYAIGGAGTTTSIEASPYLEFNDLGAIS